MATCVLKSTGCLAILLAGMLCVHGERAQAQVTTDAGLNDLVILDPGKHERGLPAVEIKRDSEGHQTIDIPPKLHVHRYYYSGDKIFQGPILQGGPVVVVANNPKTGERMNIDVVLPPGAPRIAYSANSISYIYNDHKRVEIKFQHFPFDPNVAVAKHHSGKGVGLHLHDASEHVHEHVTATLESSQTVNSLTELAVGGHNLVKGAATSCGGLSKKGVDTIKQFARMIPGVTYLASKADQKPQRDFESKVRHASLKKDRTEIPFVRTNR